MNNLLRIAGGHRFELLILPEDEFADKKVRASPASSEDS